MIQFDEFSPHIRERTTLITHCGQVPDDIKPERYSADSAVYSYPAYAPGGAGGESVGGWGVARVSRGGGHTCDASHRNRHTAPAR